MSDTRCEKHKGYSVTVCFACLQARVAKLEKCRLELIDVTNACRDPRVNLTHTLEQCINDLYKRADAAEARIEKARGFIRQFELSEIDDVDCLSSIMETLATPPVSTPSEPPA